MLDTSKIYTSNNYGDFRVIKYLNAANVTVEFIKTGFTSTIRASDIIKGRAKDKLLPSVYGVGYIGDGNHKVSINRKVTKAYQVWSGMLERCYCPKSHLKNPTYEKCDVHPDWHDFQRFALWFELNYIDGYHIDKDIKINGNKTYSCSACTFVSQAENTIKASAKNYEFINPQGVAVSIYNLKEFCRGTELIDSEMGAVHLMKSRSHKGWVKG